MSVKGKNAVDLTLKGLSRLEYRGYDSCGIAMSCVDNIRILKSVGYVENLIKRVNNISIDNCDMAIGHTRWATHGAVSIENCHPQTSYDESIVVVHNGIIENYMDIKNTYLSSTQFVSDTDTEVIPNLVKMYIDLGYSTIGAIGKCSKELHGSFAFALMIDGDSNLYFAKKSSPLVVAKNTDSFIVASDINGLSGEYDVCYLEDGMYGYIDNCVHIYDSNGIEIDINYISKPIIDNRLDEQNDDYMQKEIYEMPVALKNTYRSMLSKEYILPKSIGHVLIVACGTSYHSGLMGKKYIEKFGCVSCECEIASEFIYNDYIVRDNTLAIFISQSGETADTLCAMRKAKKLGLYCLAITNVDNSTISRECDECILMSAGAEIAVASTKAYSTQVFVMLMLSNMIRNIREGLFDIDSNFARANIVTASNFLPIQDEDYSQLFQLEISQFENNVSAISRVLSDKQGIHFIGKNFDYITAMEGSLKLKEISYKFTDAYPSGELKHGTLSLIDNVSYSIVIVTDSSLVDKCKNAIHEITSRGGSVIIVTQFIDSFIDYPYVIKLPDLSDVFMPIVSIMPIDLLAYRVTKLLGLNPDKPRNLAKSVTVE